MGRLSAIPFVALAFALGATLSQCATGVKVDDPAPAPTDTNRDGGPTPGKDAGCVMQCGGKCTDTQNDPTNCGKCANACPPSATCEAGNCKCATGKLCTGKCVDTQVDAKNCGQCGNDCAGGDGGSSGGTWSCVAGACSLSCTGGQIACNGACFDPQATDTHCGTCNNDCTTTSASCCTGSCANTATDPLNCGGCGTVCGGGGKCTNSKCCSLEPTGSCLQNPCTTGGPLTPGCDGTGCVAKVCAADPYCCDTSFGLWDSGCVSEVTTYCAPQYKCQC